MVKLFLAEPSKSHTKPMHRRGACGALLVMFLACLAGCTGATRGGDVAGGPPSRTVAGDEVSGKTPKTRRFRFVYGATVTGLTPGARARVWLPLATSSDAQEIQRVRINVPGKYRRTREKTYGNALIYFEAVANAAGNIPLSVEYTVRRHEVLVGEGEEVDPRETIKFLAPSTMVPVDGSLAASIFGEKKLATGTRRETAAQIYRAVNERMTYNKPSGKPWGRGDARWACDSRFGNCTDFHSVFIAVARDLKIPSKFEIGFPIGTDKPEGEVGGYHCWAKFLHERRWVAVDISEANKHPEMTEYYFGNLTPDRILFTTGRDLMLDPPQKAGPVNFLVYPYVEVDGKPHTQFTKQFRYAALD